MSGLLPNPLLCEAYCHSLTDPSILSPGLRDLGVETLTVFGLHTPYSLFGVHRIRRGAPPAHGIGAGFAEFRSGRTNSGSTDD